MASIVTRRYTVVEGPIKKEYIFIDGADGTALADVETLLASPIACTIVSCARAIGSTLDASQAFNTSHAAVATFSSGNTKLIDLTSLTNDIHYILTVYGF